MSAEISNKVIKSCKVVHAILPRTKVLEILVGR